MFFPSPYGHGMQGPADEVLTIITNAQLVQTLNSGIITFLNNPDSRKAFFCIFTRKLQLIKSRSQAFEDAHVTVYDKVLLNLTRNGSDLELPAAIQYFCEEFVGINLNADQAIVVKDLEQCVGFSKLLTAYSSPSSNAGSSSIEQSKSCCERRPSNTTVDTAYDKPLKTKAPEMEPKLARLWTVYDKARGDFQAVIDKKDIKTAAAARFLRDTAENTIGYLKGKNTDPLMMAELKATYELAKDTAVSLSHGKKRKFDAVEMDRVKGTPREPYKSPYKPQNKLRRPCDEQIHVDKYDQGFDSYSGGGRMRGRGHSGIPFGYSRPVDSYHPY